MPELRTANTVGFYVDGHCISELEKAYGAHLEDMGINDRNALMVILAHFVYVNSIPMWEGTPLHVVAEEVISEDRDLTSDQFCDILETLEGIEVWQARGLLSALSS
ncbi:hypothetical protein ACKFKG_26825 [Phormidesmis sp. 146-35]